MVNLRKISLVLLLCLDIGIVNAIDMTRWAYLQKAGELDTGCLHNLTLDDNVEDQTFTPEDERNFLLELYNKTGGPVFWINRTGWGENSSIHHCQWFGVQCYPNNTYVKWIALRTNNLVGTPTNLWKFRNLQGICMSGNTKMTGRLSDIISSNMTRLRRLWVSFSGIHGTIPWNLILQLHNLEKLQICCMVAKRLTGNLPKDIGKLNKLQVFSIGENFIHGDLPLSIMNLTKVWFLDLEYVKLTSGNLTYFSKMIKLQSLHLTNCGLKGTIPEDFGRTHPDLTSLILFGNNLEGEIQNSCLVGLHNLQHLNAGKNNLHGLLPKSFADLKSLKVLDLSRNNFGGFQKSMTFNPQLETLYLNGNKHLVSEIKCLMDALQPCKDSLRILIASKSSLWGELPNEIWKLSQMTYVDLSFNNLNGNIPATSSFNLPFLFHINLASNNLSGDVNPMRLLTSLKALTYLNIQNNKYLRNKHGLQTYMKPDYNVTLHRGNFSCPSVHLTSTSGTVEMDPSYYDYTLCFCNKGFYGFANHCLQCMTGAMCENNAVSLETNTAPSTEQENSTLNVQMLIMKGYWPCCNGSDDVQRLLKCVKAETGGEEICSPSGNCNCHLEVVNEKLKTSCNSSCICRYGNTGRFCSQCIDGYYKRGDVCVQCPEFHKNFPVVTTVCFAACFLLSVVLLTCFRSHKRISLLVMFVFVVTLVVLHFKSIIPGWFFIIVFAVWILGLSSEGKSLQSFICIAVFFFQSLDAMLSEAKIWPETIILLKYKVTNVFNFELAQLMCSFSGVTKPEIAYAILLLLPVGGIAGIWLLSVLSKAFSRGMQMSTSKRFTIEILLFVYFPITAKTFSAISPCQHLDGLSYLRDAPWLDCHGSSYQWLVGLGFTSLAVFVVGVPIFVFAPLLFKNLTRDGDPVSEETDTWLRPLYEEFTPKCRRFFPLIFLARRLLLAVSLSVIPATSCYQILAITIVLIAFIAIIFITRPYQKYTEKFEFENMADIIISIVLLLSFVGLASLRNASSAETSLVSLILAINLLIVFCCIGGILVLFTVNILRNPEDGNNVQYEEIPD